jgi:hypothetical protein
MGPNTLSPKSVDKQSRLYFHLKEFFKNAKVMLPGLDVAIANQNSITKGWVASTKTIEEIQEEMKAVYYNIAYNLLEDDSYLINYPHHYLPIAENAPRIVLLDDMGVAGGIYSKDYGILALNMKFARHSNPLYFTVVLLHEVAHWRDADANTTVLDANVREDWDHTLWLNDTPVELASQLSEFASDDEDLQFAAGISRIKEYNELKIILEAVARTKSVIGVSNKYHSFKDVFNGGDYSILTEEGKNRFNTLWPASSEVKPRATGQIGGVWD